MTICSGKKSHRSSWLNAFDNNQDNPDIELEDWEATVGNGIE